MPEREFLKHHALQITQDRARRMRKAPTPSENKLWRALRNRRLGGLKFLRQHPIGPNIVDFYCHEKHLVIEVDGGIHRSGEAKDYDESREEYLEAYGVRIFRCSTEAVAADLAAVLKGILRAVAGTHPPATSL